MPLKTVSLFLFFILIFSQSLPAAIITQIKGSKVLIDNDDAEIVPNQEFYVIDKKNKKTGSLIKVISVRGEKSVAVITRGNILPGQTLLPKPFVKTKNSIQEDTDQNEVQMSEADTSEETTDSGTAGDEDTSPVYRNNGKKLGVLVNMMFNTMSAKESDGVSPMPNVENVGMAGVSLGVTGTLDYPVKPWFEFRGSAGLEPFIVSNTASINGCDNTTSRYCNTNINYLVAGGYGRFNLYQKKIINLWAGLGINFRYPITKSSTAVRTSDLNLTTSYGLVGGGEYFITHKEFIPFSIEQQFFRSSDTVTASLLSFRLGYGLSY